ncbi:glycosyltransferase [Ensifer sp. LBL]|uniref:glycosyltransferase n=1 Tax=Ensifer sp. LBL TaxID=2991056 RepID=UPI003D1E16C7
MSVAVHVHILESIGLGGLESRLEAIRRLDRSVEHVIAIPRGLQANVPKYWGGGVIELPVSPNLVCTYRELVEFHEFLGRVLGRNDRSIIHTHTPWPAIAVASAPCMVTGVHVHTIHGPIWVPWIGKGRRTFNDVITTLVDRTIAVSKEVEERARSVGVVRRLLTISNASAIEHCPKSPVRQKSGFSPLKAAFAARLDHGKCEGLYQLFDLMKDCPAQIQLDIFGDGPLLRDVSESAREVGEYVRILGADHWFRSRIPEYDLIVGEGRVVLEALSASRSVLVCGSQLATFATFENIDALTYANCTGRGLTDTRPPTAVELLDPPAPPPFPVAPSISKLNSLLAVRSTRAALARRRFASIFANMVRRTEGSAANVIEVLDKLEEENALGLNDELSGDSFRHSIRLPETAEGLP